MLTLSIYSPDKTTKYPIGIADVGELKFSTVDQYGYATCSFTVARDPREFYEDIWVTNVVIVGSGGQTVWEGEIVSTTGEVAEGASGITVECLGYARQLSLHGTCNAVGPGKASAYIVSKIVPDCGFVAGSIYTSDFNFPYVVKAAGELGMYDEVMKSLNAPNGYGYGVWEDKKFSFYPYSSTLAYIIDARECKYTMAYDLDSIYNRYCLTWTDNDDVKHAQWYPTGGADPESMGLYGYRAKGLDISGKASEEQALACAAKALNREKRMRPKSSFVTHNIYSASTGKELDPTTVRAGNMIHVSNIHKGMLTPSQQLIMNELSTFRLAETEYDAVTGELTLSPGDIGTGLEKMLARLEARTKPNG